MLQSLRIQNYAIISHLEIQFRQGLNVITGETGAGKSIILGALGLILGNRADSTTFFRQESKCIIEGTFILDKNRHSGLFEENDLDYADSTIIRREITPSGKTRAFINDTPVTLDILRDFAEKLIDIHSQHQTLLLSDNNFQLSLLDALANNKELLSKYKETHQVFKTLNNDLMLMLVQEQSLLKEQDYLKFQSNELESLNIDIEKDSSLEEEMMLLQNAETIKSNLQITSGLLNEDEISISHMLSQGIKLLDGISKFNPKIRELKERLESISIEINDIYSELNTYEKGIEYDPQRLAEIIQRVDEINRLLKKHNISEVSGLLNLLGHFRQRINAIESTEEKTSLLKKHLSEVKAELEILAKKLSDARKAVCESTSSSIEKLLSEIGIRQAKVILELEKLPMDTFNENGKDKPVFLFSANAGIPPQPLSRVASGGELSRLMLSVKHLLAESYLIPTLIFDEIDMGVSGEIAMKVGEMLLGLSKNHQVIMITHLPQIAAMGNEHFVVYKSYSGNTTETKIKTLSTKERVMEIAQMIGGNLPTENNMKTAKELLEKFR